MNIAQAAQSDEFPSPRSFSMDDERLLNKYRIDSRRYANGAARAQREARARTRQAYSQSSSTEKAREDASVRAPGASASKTMIGKMRFIAAAIMLVAAFAIWGAVSAGMSSALSTVTDKATLIPSTGPTSPVSTPRAYWKRGEVPLLYQTDNQWAANAYADGTIATHGCGPTCLSMVYVALTGATDKDPSAMAEFSTSQGYIDGGVTSWLLMSEGARKLGLTSQEVPADIGALRTHLSAGRPVICSMAKGDFTDSGHFIVLSGLSDNGQLIVRDPNSAERTATTWDIQRVMGQCRNMWAFSV